MIKVGQKIKFWSEKVFGVPVPAKVLKVGPKYIHVEANFYGVVWKTKIHPARVLND